MSNDEMYYNVNRDDMEARRQGKLQEERQYTEHPENPKSNNQQDLHRFIYSTIAYAVASCELQENHVDIITQATEEIVKKIIEIQNERLLSAVSKIDFNL